MAGMVAVSGGDIFVPDNPVLVPDGSPLALARALVPPTVNGTSDAEYEGVDFWMEHEGLLTRARMQWGMLHGYLYSPSPEDVFNSRVLHALSAHPSSVGTALWTLASKTQVDGVFVIDLFTEKFLHDVRQELLWLRSSGVPLRRPNGMNRFGCILSDLGFDALIELLADMVVRPLSKLAFPQWVRDDDMRELYAFSVQYAMGGDLELSEHADASCVTLNVCLGDVFDGGALAFRGVRFKDKNADRREWEEVPQQLGKAVLHMGQHIHSATRLQSGTRENLIIWLMGEHGVVRAVPYDHDDDEERNDIMAAFTGKDEL